jgi:hypothetical protein
MSSHVFLSFHPMILTLCLPANHIPEFGHNHFTISLQFHLASVEITPISN